MLPIFDMSDEFTVSKDVHAASGSEDYRLTPKPGKYLIVREISIYVNSGFVSAGGKLAAYFAGNALTNENGAAGDIKLSNTITFRLDAKDKVFLGPGDFFTADFTIVDGSGAVAQVAVTALEMNVQEWEAWRNGA